jgi:hypothetical protein
MVGQGTALNFPIFWKGFLILLVLSPCFCFPHPFLYQMEEVLFVITHDPVAHLFACVERLFSGDKCWRAQLFVCSALLLAFVQHPFSLLKSLLHLLSLSLTFATPLIFSQTTQLDDDCSMFSIKTNSSKSREIDNFLPNCNLNSFFESHKVCF